MSQERITLLPNQRLNAQDAKMADALNKLVRQQPATQVGYENLTHEHVLTKIVGKSQWELTVDGKRKERNLTIRVIDPTKEDEVLRLRRGNFANKGWQFDGAEESWSIGLGFSSFDDYGTTKIPPEEAMQMLRLAYYQFVTDASSTALSSPAQE